METREEVLRAFVCVDEARRRDASWPVGVKDIFDTADFPTEYGSLIYAGFQPRIDAAAVALLRNARADIVGKTVTTEFAMFQPGPTRNPHRITHTPGGSSSGSAAAVAAGLVEAAIGTQTGGSVIRPASFCGVYGFKPTFGVVPTAGVKPLAPSLDTVGWFGRDIDAIERVWSALTARPTDGSSCPSFGLLKTEQWDDADADCRQAVLDLADKADAVQLTMPGTLIGLATEQQIVQGYEAARALAGELRDHRGRLSDQLIRILDWGAAITPDEYDRVVARAGVAKTWPFDVDILVTPAVVGEAPATLDTTGDARFCRLWTLLGWPTMSAPGATGATGMPIGVQLVARPGMDTDLFTAARAL